MARNIQNISSPVTESDIIREYYTHNDYFLSPEGILKVISALVCVAAALVFLSGGRCEAAGLLASTTSVLFTCGAALCCLYAGVVLGAPSLAPQLWLYTDIIVSTVTGVLMLVIGLLSITLCGMTGLINNLYSPLVLVNAGLVTGSAVVTYARVMRRWDAARARRPRPSAPREQDA